MQMPENNDAAHKPKRSRLGKLTLQKDIFDTALKDNLKSTVDIVVLFEHFGVKLTQKGKSYIGTCPWHDDSTPSLSVDKAKGLYNCFGCGESGDIFTLVEKMRSCTFSEAMTYIQENMGHAFSSGKKHADIPADKGEAKPATPKRVQPERKQSGAEDKKMRAASQNPATLDAVSTYYRKNFRESTSAREYLKNRGISVAAMKYFQVGYADGTIKKTVGADGEEALTELGILISDGYELLRGCVTFPITDCDGRVLSFYGRTIDERHRTKHFYLPGEHKAVFHEKAYQVYDAIILTESVIDALSLYTTGVQNVSCIYGTQGLTKLHIEKLYEHTVREVILALDNDEPGRKAVEKYMEVLINEGFTVKVIFPAGKDWNADLITGVLHKDKILSSIEEVKAVKPEPSGRSFRKTDSGLVLFHNELEYTVKSENASYRQSIKCTCGDDVYYDRVDLFSARSRSSFANSIAKLFDVPSKQVDKDLIALLEYLEDAKEEQAEETEIVLTEEDKQLGLSFLQNPHLFDEIVQDTEILGYVGEETNKKLMYLAATSRLLDDPISILILSESGSGKSYLVDTIKKLMPPEDVIDVTSLSDQALNYMGDLEHKFMSLSEAVHKDVIEHQLREMVSNKELRRLVTKKDEKSGTMKAEQVSVKAVVSLVMSSTNYNVNPENASRSFIINTDESEEQSKRIFKAQAQKMTSERRRIQKHEMPKIIHKHRCAQRMLQQYVVEGDFDTYRGLSGRIMRYRRDHERFIDLIGAVCFLRQYQKDVKQGEGYLFIECDDTDVQIARKLMEESGLLIASEMPKSAKLLYDYLQEYAKEEAGKKGLEIHDISFTQRQIREYTGLSHMSVKRGMKVLVEYEYVELVAGGRARSKGIYRLSRDEWISPSF